MRYIKYLLFICLCSACVIKQKNVLMIPRREEPGVVKLYFDKNGNLYPTDVHVTPYFFYLENIPGRKKRYSDDYATIESALTKYDSISKFYVSQRYHLPVTDSIKLFKRLQALLKSNAVAKMEQSMRDNNQHQLIVLIHGFNDPTPDAYYFALRKSITEYTKTKPTFVEVYWDGLNALGDYTMLPAIWKYSQHNAAKVGLSLRNVLNAIDTNTQLVFITHSLGSSVATNALFNQTKWDKGFNEILKDKYQSEQIKTLPQKAILLGMIAPAISGVETFRDVNNTVPKDQPLKLNRVIIGYNHYDYAVTKGGLFPHWFGSTALGADADKEVGKTITILNNKNPDVKCDAINFSLSKLGLNDIKKNKQYRQTDHSMIAYQNNEHFPDFLEQVFGK